MSDKRIPHPDSVYEKVAAIPTTYRGVLFASRLEARWAKYFDLLGIEWEYEPESFALAGGTYVVPDFRLFGKDGALYAEVKPVVQGLYFGDQFKRSLDVATDHGLRMLCLHGPPNLYLVYDGLCGASGRPFRTDLSWENIIERHVMLSIPGLWKLDSQTCKSRAKAVQIANRSMKSPKLGRSPKFESEQRTSQFDCSFLFTNLLSTR